MARKYAQRIERELVEQLASGGGLEPITWDELLQKYRNLALSHKATGTIGVEEAALRVFTAAVQPRRPTDVNASAIDRFIAARRREPGQRPGSTLSASSVNKELRILSVVLRKAAEWNHIFKAPAIRYLKETQDERRTCTSEDLQRIYDACPVATLPVGTIYEPLPYKPVLWWRAILTFLSCTGWRIGQTLSLQWADVDLDARTARAKANQTKAGRHAATGLPEIVVDHLKKIRTFGYPLVFPIGHTSRRTLFAEWQRIQLAAGIDLPCVTSDPHDCVPACHLYGFHALRRHFATENALHLSAFALQTQMQHRSLQTTQRYVRMAESKATEIADAVKVPAFLSQRRLG